MKIEKINEELVVIKLENGRTCDFRTIEAAERMKLFVNDIKSNKNKILEIIELENNQFDIQYNEEYKKQLKDWINEYRNFEYSEFKNTGHFCVQFELKNRLFRILPYAKAIHVSKEGQMEWVVGDFEMYRVPENLDEFKFIVDNL